jgi:hypothetical protein
MKNGMKLIAILVISIMVVFNLGLISKSSDLSDVSLANIEALASESSSALDAKCSKGKKNSTYGLYKLVKDSKGYCTYQCITDWEDDGSCNWKSPK